MPNISLEANTALAKGTETNPCIMKNYKTINLCTVFRTFDLKAFHRSRNFCAHASKAWVISLEKIQ